MKFCKDCKHFIPADYNWTTIDESNDRCSKYREPVRGVPIMCTVLRSSINPQCGTIGRGFESKELLDDPPEDSAQKIAHDTGSQP